MSIPEDFKFDSRIRSRFLRKQVLTTAEVDRHLEALPDLEGEYEVMSEVPQPAVTPARSEVKEEPIVFDGIRRLQALSDASSSATRSAAPAPAPSAPSAPAYREPEPRPLGTPLRSLMETEISGVGVGAVAALGAMAAEERNSGTFGQPSLGSPFAPQPAVSPFAAPSPAFAPPPAPPAPAVTQPTPAPASEPEPPTGPTPQTLRSEGSPAPAAASDEPATASPDESDEEELG